MLRKTFVAYNINLADVANGVLKVEQCLPPYDITFRQIKVQGAQHWPIREDGHNML